MNLHSKDFTVSPYFTFFLIHSLQIGVGILGFQRIIIKHAGYDAWISIIIMGVITHFVLFCMLKMLEKDNDLINIHTTCFGKWLGNAFTIFFMLYYGLSCLTIFRTYIEVVQVWIFPTIKLWQVGLIILFVVYYTLSGGFRSIAGMCFWGVILSLFILAFFVFPLKYAHFRNILPVFTHSFSDIMLSTKQASLEFLGFEALLMFYPLIEKGKSVKRWAHFSIFFTTFLYVFVALLSFVYFSEGLLQHTVWGTLTMFKIIKIPFIQRFEYVIIFLWFLIILPNLCLTIWASCQAARRSFQLPFKVAFPIFISIIYISSLFFMNRESINILNTYTSKFGLYLIYVYIPVLFVWHYFCYRLKSKTSS